MNLLIFYPKLMPNIRLRIPSECKPFCGIYLPGSFSGRLFTRLSSFQSSGIAWRNPSPAVRAKGSIPPDSQPLPVIGRRIKNGNGTGYPTGGKRLRMFRLRSAEAAGRKTGEEPHRDGLRVQAGMSQG
jgi:hypothetical protein